ncbi:MAG: fasciclin domain-containing protein [Acetobacteraceae bacterium]
MFKLFAAAALAGSLGACSAGMAASTMPAGNGMSQGTAMMNPMVGGKAMMPSMNIVQNALNSPDHTTLVAAVKAAGLVATLEGPGPFTVFAPTNEAFAALPAGTVPTLLQPANKAKLVKILTYHVVPGRLDFAAMRKLIEAGGGKAMLKTVEGGTLTIMMNGPRNIVVEDAHGDIADISTYDVYQSNGVIQVIDKVLLP